MLLLAQPSPGEAGVVQVLAADNPLRIRGRVGDDSSFVRKIGLFAHEHVWLVFRPTDLRPNHRAQIGHPQVVATGATEFDLPRNAFRDFEIKATGIKIPGAYVGKVQFFRPAQGMNPVLEIPITVIAEGVPKLSQRNGSESVKIQLVNCGPPAFFGRQWACLLGAWGWLQPNAFPSTYPLQFDNGSLEPFPMTASVTAIGDATRASLDHSLSIEHNVEVPVRNVYTLPITIHAVKPPPDHYLGDVQLRLFGQDAPLKIPLEVNVRTGPTPSAFALFFGILLGRLLKHLDKGGRQSDLLLSVDRLQRRINASPAVQNKQAVSAQVEAARARVYNMQLSEASRDLVAIEHQRLGGPAGELPPIVRTISRLTGHSVVLHSEIPSWAFRTLSFVLLIGALVFLGLQQLYLKNPTFGSNLVSDYFGVFIWATSSDVASRTLSTLRAG